MEKKYNYLYKTTNLITGKYYIGMHSTNNLDDGYLGSGRVLKRSIKKYGSEKHRLEIIGFFDTRKDLVNKEIEVVTEEIINDTICMNLMSGGMGGFISEEQQKRRSIAGGKAHAERIKNDVVYREEFSKRMSEKMKQTNAEGKIKYNTFSGRTHTDETKKKMSNTKKGTGIGKQNSQYGTCWVTKDGKNKKIKKEELQNYLDKGYSRGRILKNK